MNLETLNLQELSYDEMSETEGGWFSLVIAAVVAFSLVEFGNRALGNGSTFFGPKNRIGARN